MNSSSIPPLVRLVLSQAVRFRSNGGISQHTFNSQVDRITREELQPRGLSLVMRELSGGRVRFIVKANSTGEVRDQIECAVA